VKCQTANIVPAMIAKGSQVLMKLMKLTYLPKKNIHAASLTMFHLVDPSNKLSKISEKFKRNCRLTCVAHQTQSHSEIHTSI
jgi:hypothetical protein